MTSLSETTAQHTRMMKYTLELDNARAWWGRSAEEVAGRDVVDRAFAGSWFGTKSLPRVRVLITNLRARFDAFPEALSVLRGWQEMEPGTRAAIGHWHTQLSDPIYRAFSGGLLVQRHDSARGDVTRDMVIRWVGEHAPGRWTMATRAQLATQLLVTAKAAGLIENLKDPRRLVFPRIDDHALGYLLYLLRGVRCEGSLLDNPYLASVGLTPKLAEDRLRAVPGLRFSKQGDLIDFGWQFDCLESWAAAMGITASTSPTSTSPTSTSTSPTSTSHTGRGAV